MSDQTYFPTRRELRAAERAQAAALGVDEAAGATVDDIIADPEEMSEQTSTFDEVEEAPTADPSLPRVELGPALAALVEREEKSQVAAPSAADPELPHAELAPALAALVDTAEQGAGDPAAGPSAPELDADDGWVSPFGDVVPQPIPALRPVQSVSEPDVDAEDLFHYPTGRVEADPEPIFPAGTLTIQDEQEAELESERTPNKGVNMFSMIGVTAAIVGAVFMFMPSLAVVALPIAGFGVLATLVGAVMPHYLRLPSIVALAVALGAGGYVGYINFLA